LRYLLDTSFAIDYLRGTSAATRRFASVFADGDDPYVNEVVLSELAVGVDGADDPAFAAFVRALSFVQPPPEAAIRAGQWRRAASRQGRTLDLADALIAAAADALDAPILTRNRRDFALTPVEIEDY